MKNLSDSLVAVAPVDVVLQRISEALGVETWMSQMEVQPETVRTWRKRGEVPVKQLLRAAQRSGKSVEYFNAPVGQGEPTQPAAAQPVADDEFTPIEMVEACISAGHGAVNGEQEVIGKFAFRTSWLKAKGLNRENAKIVRVKGRSMADRINDGDILLVNTSVNALTQDGVYVIELDGEDYVKLLQRDFSSGGVRVISYNPAFPTQVLEGSAANRLRICGRVVWHGGEL
jgi:phage repressor protein C with HTH and peptisase S24 domain